MRGDLLIGMIFACSWARGRTELWWECLVRVDSKQHLHHDVGKLGDSIRKVVGKRLLYCKEEEGGNY